MTGPWEQYSQPNNAPWKKYAPVEEPSFLQRAKDTVMRGIDASAQALNAESEMMSKDTGEATASLATGAMSWIPAGLSMIQPLVAVGSGAPVSQFAKGAERAKRIQEKLTYTPRSESAKQAVETITSPITKMAELGHDSQAKYYAMQDEALKRGDKKTAEMYGQLGLLSGIGGEFLPFLLPAFFKGAKELTGVAKQQYRMMTVKERAVVNSFRDKLVKDIKEGNLTVEQIKEAWQNPENRELLVDKYVRGKSEGRVEPKFDTNRDHLEDKALPNASYEGKGQNFTMSEPKPTVILRKGEPTYSAGEVNPDLVVENIPYKKRNAKVRKQNTQVDLSKLPDKEIIAKQIKEQPIMGTAKAPLRKEKAGGENIVAFLINRGKVRLGEDFTSRSGTAWDRAHGKRGKDQSRELGVIKEVSSKNGALSMDEAASVLNAAGFKTREGKPFTDVDLFEELAYGDPRKIYNPENAEKLINRDIAREENEWIERQLADLAAKETIDTGTAREGLSDIQARAINEIREEGVLDSAKESEALKEIEDFFRIESLRSKINSKKANTELEGFSEQENFNLTNPETEISKSLPQQPTVNNSKLFDERGSFSWKPKEAIERTGKEISKDTKDIFVGFGKVTDEYLGAISTRLGNIHPSLKYTLRDFEFTRGIKATQRSKRVLPMLEKVNKMTPEDRIAFDLARKNGDPVELKKYVSKYGLGKEYHELRNVLSELRDEAIKQGYEVGYVQNYHPRVLKDKQGFLEYMYKQKDWPVIEEAIKRKEADLQRYLDADEKATLINSLLRGYTGKIGLSKPGQLKERSVQTVTPELNQFYMDSDAALVHYIHSITDAVEARRLFGVGIKGKEGAKGFDVQDTIGGYVLKLLDEGKIKPEQERVLTDILKARFNEVGTSGIFSIYKNLSYVDTMGSMISAITQIGDVAWALYRNGIKETAAASGKAVIGKSKFKKEDLGVEQIASEFSDSSKTARAVELVFKYTGLSKLDNIGKEALINSTYEAAVKKASTREGTVQLQKELHPIFGNETGQLIADLRNGTISENVKLYLFNTLSDFQPISLSEMPQKYLTGGNGRIFYMLKTFTLKQFDVARREAFQKIATEGTRIEGTKNLVRLAACFVAANAAADEIKDFVLGRDTDLSDKAVDNLLRLLGVSKFITWHARKEGVGSAIVKQIAPPFKAADAITKDIANAGDGKGLETTQSIPVVGKLYYWWFGKGANKKAKDNKRDTREKKETRPKRD